MQDKNVIYQVNTYRIYKKIDFGGEIEVVYKVVKLKNKDLSKIGFNAKNSKIKPKDNKFFAIYRGTNERNFFGKKYFDTWEIFLKTTIEDCLKWIEKEIEREGNLVINKRSEVVINKINEV